MLVGWQCWILWSIIFLTFLEIFFCICFLKLHDLVIFLLTFLCCFLLWFSCSVMGYTLLLSLIEYKTLVMRGDLERASEVLPSIPKEHHNRYSSHLLVLRYWQMDIYICPLRNEWFYNWLLGNTVFLGVHHQHCYVLVKLLPNRNSSVFSDYILFNFFILW